MSRLGALVLLAGVAGTVLGLEVREEFCDLPVSGHVHASTLLPLKTAGDYQVAWFEGTKEGHPDVAIRGARRRSGVWESVRTLAKVNPVSQHWNPVLRRADDGRIELFFKVGRNCSDWRTYVQDSRDDGNTWSAPRELVFGEVGGGRGPVKNKCLKLKSGRWLAPASTEIGVWRAFADISDDDGRTWRASPPFPIPAQAEKRFGVIQPTFWEDKGGVHAFMRANDGWVWRTDSQDNGETWREVYRSSLENINSGLDCVCASDGRLYLALNGKDPSAGKAWSWGTRNHLELRVSEDGGTSWRTLLILAHDQPRQPDGRITEFSYPAIIEARPGVLALTHTWNRQRIRFLEIELSARSSACSEKDARTEETPFESRVKWIAAQEPFMAGVGHPRWFRAETTVGEGLVKAVAHWWFDDAGALYVDGKKAGASGTGKECDLTAFFKKPGRHIVAVENTNLAGMGGICLAVHFAYGDGRTESFHTSDAWRCAKQAAKGWELPTFNDSAWERVRVFDDVLASPWSHLRDMVVFMPSDERTAYASACVKEKNAARGLLERLGNEPKPRCRVVYDRGRSRFDIGGKRYETTFYNVTEDWDRHNRKLLRQVAGLRDAGVHLYGLGVDTRKVWRADGGIDFAQLEEPMRSALVLDPEARFMFCISTYMPPKWWVRAHPDELVGYANGTVNFNEEQCLKNVAVPSFASMKWRRDVADYETRLVRHLENSPYASRIFAYRTDFGINHEWHSYGMRDNLMPDCGKAMTAAFRDWLRATYSNDVAALRRAWGDPRVDFATALTPSPAQRTRGEPRDPIRDRAVTDYERCHAAMVRDCLFAFNQAIKEACGGRALVGNYCGYFFGLPEVAEGCHLENDAILDSPWVDFQCSPFVYGPNARRAGAPQYARCLLEGLRSRGKVALMEADNSTSLAGIGYSHYSNTFEEDEAILARDFVQTLCWGCGFWYFDFGQGWYAHPRYDAFFKKIFPIRSRDADCSSISEVLVVGDYESILFSNVKLPVARHTRCTTEQITELGHAGVPFDSASFADLAAGRLKDYKVYFFPNLLYVTPEKMAVVEKLRAAGKTLLWVDTPGILTPRGGDPSNVERLTGRKPEEIPPAPLKRDELRRILRAAGVHIFSEDSESSLYANASYVALHSAKPGRQTIRLPHAATVTELYPEHRELGAGMREIVFDAKAPATTLFSWE